MFNKSRAQMVCDSIFMICDSISIDSVYLNQPNSPNWLIFDVSIDHSFLYAPTFVICPAIDSVQFVNDKIDFFGIFGPSTSGLDFQFLNFNFPNGFEISGKIVVDNYNNGNNNCQIPFNIIVNEMSQTNDSYLENSVYIIPNPTNDLLVVKLQNENEEILNIQLFNIAGIKQSISFTENTIDLSEIIPGFYTIHLELRNRKRIIKKIIKKE